LSQPYVLPLEEPPQGGTPYGGFVSAFFESPTSFPAPKGLGLSWEVYSIYVILFMRKNDVNVG